jgi:hypothetical protein
VRLCLVFPRLERVGVHVHARCRVAGPRLKRRLDDATGAAASSTASAWLRRLRAMRALPFGLAVGVLVAACNSAAPGSASARASAQDESPSAAATTAPSGSEGPTDPDEVTLNQFFDTMRTRLLARVDAMGAKKYKSRVGYATDLAMLTPDAMFGDARNDLSAYGPAGLKASHILGARPELGKRAIDAYVKSVSQPVEALTRRLGPSVAPLPKANRDDCLDTLRMEADDHTLGSALGPILMDCMDLVHDKEMKCMNDSKSRSDFDKCIASTPPHPH